jgi:AraC-like DNA-binding protein
MPSTEAEAASDASRKTGAPVAVSITHRPAGHLSAYVESAVGYHYAGFGPGVHRGVPSRHLTVVVSLDRPLDMTMPDDGQTPVVLGALAAGLHERSVSIHHDGVQHGVQLQLTPAGARALLGLPASELAHEVVPLDAVLRTAPELTDRLMCAGSWSERFAALDDLLARAVESSRPPRPPRPEVGYVFDRILATAGTLDVAALAREVGWSRRHLTDQFGREYGLTPKVLARVARFERARWLVAEPRRPTLADVAAVCGYADQAHMNRDWVAFTGTSPGAWLAEEQLPFVQDGVGDSPAQWSS